MSEYDEQAQKFLSDTKTDIKIEFLKHDKHFLNEEETRDIYKITLKRGSREFSFNFGQSTAESGFKLINENNNKEIKYIWFSELTYLQDRNKEKLRKDIINKIGNLGCFKLEFGKEPSAYDVLACLTTYDPETFKDFCNEFGYDNDSIKADKVYIGVVNEFKSLQGLYSDEELEKLGEIQ